MEDRCQPRCPEDVRHCSQLQLQSSDFLLECFGYRRVDSPFDVGELLEAVIVESCRAHIMVVLSLPILYPAVQLDGLIDSFANCSLELVLQIGDTSLHILLFFDEILCVNSYLLCFYPLLFQRVSKSFEVFLVLDCLVLVVVWFDNSNVALV